MVQLVTLPIHTRHVAEYEPRQAPAASLAAGAFLLTTTFKHGGQIVRCDLQTDLPPYQEGKSYLIELNGLLFQATYDGLQSTIGPDGDMPAAVNGCSVMHRWVNLVYLRPRTEK